MSAPSPWTRLLIEQELQYENGKNLIAFQESEHTTPVGWCCAHYLPPEAELLKITVHKKYRYGGVGTLLMGAFIQNCSDRGCNTIFTEVRENNLIARQFYHKSGFIEVGKRKKYYRAPTDNCITLQLSLSA